MTTRIRLLLERCAFFGLLVVLWAIAARQLGSTVVPPPTDVVRHLDDLLRDPLIWADIRLSLGQVAMALVVATAVGVGLGVLAWRFSLFHDSAFPWLAVVNTIPSVLLYPVAIVLFGLGTASTVVLSVFLGTMVIAESTYAGLRGVERVYLDVAAVFQASRLDVFRKVLLPGAMDIIVTGLRIGFTLVFVVVIATGYILSGGGLGYRLRFFYESFAMTDLYALIVVIIVLSLGCQFLLLGLLRMVRRSNRATIRESAIAQRLDPQPVQ